MKIAYFLQRVLRGRKEVAVEPEPEPLKLGWLTDIHLNFFTNSEQRKDFYNQIKHANCNALIISGDIMEAPSLKTVLQEMQKHLQMPIYFILGNHDYYNGDITTVRQTMRDLNQTDPNLRWLPASGPISIARDIFIVGQDGWADGRLGDYAQSAVVLRDSILIKDLAEASQKGQQALLTKMQNLADQDAKNLTLDLERALEQGAKTIIVATHIPAFKECCWYKGEMTNDDYLPFFSSKATGDVLLKFAQIHPKVQLKVFSGHTHTGSSYSPKEAPNLVIKCGTASYGKPEVQEVITVESLNTNSRNFLGMKK